MTHPKHTSCQHEAYRLTCEDYDALWGRAQGKCEICRTPADQATMGGLVIDHDDSYGYLAVRGLLCRKCNSGIGANAKAEATEEERRYLREPWFLEMLGRRHAENIAAARRPQRKVKLVLGSERAAHVAQSATD